MNPRRRSGFDRAFMNNAAQQRCWRLGSAPFGMATPTVRPRLIDARADDQQPHSQFDSLVDVVRSLSAERNIGVRRC
jgi:hypothetical protein